MQLIKDTVEILANSKYSLMKSDQLNRQELLLKLLDEKIVFVESASENSGADSDAQSFMPAVGYSFDSLIIPDEMSENEKRMQIMIHALRLVVIKEYKEESKVVVNSGFEKAVFVKGKHELAICDEINGIELNNVARRVYSSFLLEAWKKPDLSLNEFINLAITKDIDDNDQMFLLCSNAVGNEMLFEAFRESDSNSLDNVLRTMGTSFEEFTQVFEKGLDLEFARKLYGIQDSPNKLLTGEVFEQLFHGIEPWLVAGIYENEHEELITLAKEYFIESSFGRLFGAEIDVEAEIQSIKKFYSEFFNHNYETKLIFFKKVQWVRKYRVLKEQSYSLAKDVLNADAVDEDIKYDAKSILVKSEKLNHSLEKENEDIQKSCFEDIKETFLNCMFATTNDRSAMGTEIGELASWQETVNAME